MLALLATTQFVLVLDITIVTVALPTIQRELGFQQAELQWLVTGYALTFGGFLLLAGRAADLFGRRRMFVVGILLFGTASLGAGLAVNELMLAAARAGQGLAGAFVSPAALALLTTTFREGRERNRALGVFGAVASAGGASGLLLGGVITEWAGWRWVFLVNVPIAVAAAIAAPRIVSETRRPTVRRLDLPGATTITSALLALIYGLTRGEQAGFDDRVTVASLAAAVVLASVFALIERRSVDPLVPFRLFRLPTLAGTDLTSFAVSTLISATPFFLSLYIQRVLDLTPVETGFAFLPMALTIMATSALAARLAAPIGVKPLLLAGLAALIGGSLFLSHLPVRGSYLGDVLPGMTLFALGLALSYTTTTIGGTAGVPDADQGLAGGLLNTFNQVGGAVGLAVLATVASATSEHSPASTDAALVAGLRAAFLAAVGFAVLGVLIAVTLIRERDCEEELARRQRDEAVGLDPTVAGCLAALRGQVIEERP
ncbi:MAG: MFS transporter [Actinomycetota bacterium]|nr:MFS transporter [Actinomycetota bacterium]